MPQNKTLNFLERFGFKDISRMIKFAMAGALGVIFNESILYLLTEKVGIFYLISGLVAIEASIIFVFLINEFFVFRDRRMPGKFQFLKRLVKSNLARVGGMIINLITLFLLVEFFYVYYLLANLVGIALGFLLNYSLSFAWVWVKN